MTTESRLNVVIEDGDDDDDDDHVAVATVLGSDVVTVYLTAVVALPSLKECRFELLPTVKEF